MPADEQPAHDGPGTSFGNCCPELHEAMNSNQFEPLIAKGDDGILYMSVGLIDLEDGEPGMVDHPVFFCPFCGTHLQNVDELKFEIAGDDAPQA